MKSRIFPCLLWFVALMAVGCERAPLPKFVTSKQVEAIGDKGIQQRIATILEEQCGTPDNIKLLGADNEAEAEHLAHGLEVYRARCVQCHGTSGDGNGDAAKYLTPRPRDYRRGAFKFKSTQYNSKPLRKDLVRTIQQGIVGTSMPTFALLPESDLEAVVDYVLALTHRGELELQLAIYGQDYDNVKEFDEALKDEGEDFIPLMVESVVRPWQEAPDDIVHPLTRMPKYSKETVELGRKAFLSRGCSKCHGPDGRGRTQDNVGTDIWGNFDNAADLTSGMLHGGQRPIDVYRRVYAGIYGTPMPSFELAFSSEPETFWHLAHFVLHTANQRRESLPGPPHRGKSSDEDAAAADEGTAPSEEESAEQPPAAEESAEGESAEKAPAAETAPKVVPEEKAASEETTNTEPDKTNSDADKPAEPAEKAAPAGDESSDKKPADGDATENADNEAGDA